jgi:hypothetical protein
LGCGPHTRHQLDGDIDLYVCDCCGDGVLDAPATDADMWELRSTGEVKPTEPGHVWFDEHRDQPRVRL